MSKFKVLRETNLDQSKDYWLVAWPLNGTCHGYLFFNPDSEPFWDEYKTGARSYETVESAEAQIALLETLGKFAEPRLD